MMDRPVLDRYELKEELGQGGMSVVYRALDAQLNRDVAVKILHRFLAQQPESRRRLHREAMAVARLRHRAIVEIYDYSGSEASEAFIVCELIEGPTLREWVDVHGAPGPVLALMVGRELASALDHAHDQGIIHRDLKPENVMINPEGQLKLMDFGIAQVLEGQTRLTATGTLIGSPAHMAPEVIDGKPTDHRSDIFSLGTLMYWLAVGSLPFQAPHPSALFKRILDGDFVSAGQVDPRVGRRTSRLIDRCLSPNPDDRPQSAQALVEEINLELEHVRLLEDDGTLRRILQNPEAHIEAFRERLVAILMDRANEAFEAGDWGRASDDVNRVLARRPEHPEARALLEQLARGERRQAWRRRLVVVGLPAAATAAALWLVARSIPSPPGPEPETPRLRVAELQSEVLESEGEPALPARTRPPTPRRSPPPPADRSPTRSRPARTPTTKAVAPEPASDVVAHLTVQIGRGYADVWVDDALVLDLAFQGRIKLGPGRHSIQVVRDRDKILARLGLDEVPTDRPFPQFGRFKPRIVEVGPEGELFEVGPQGRQAIADDVLRFSIPLNTETEARTEDWISS